MRWEVGYSVQCNIVRLLHRKILSFCSVPLLASKLLLSLLTRVKRKRFPAAKLVRSKDLQSVLTSSTDWKKGLSRNPACAVRPGDGTSRNDRA